MKEKKKKPNMTENLTKFQICSQNVIKVMTASLSRTSDLKQWS